MIKPRQHHDAAYLQLLQVDSPLYAELQDAALLAGWELASAASPAHAAVRVLLLDGSDAALTFVDQAIEGAAADRRPTVLVVAAAQGTAQLGLLQVPASWQWLAWPAPAGWLELTLQRADRLAVGGVARERPAAATPDTPDQALAVALGESGLFDFEYDLATGARRPSSRDRQVIGHSPDDIDSVLGLIHPDDRSRARAAFEACRDSGARYQVKLRAVLKDGSYRWIRSEGAVVERTPSHPGRLMGVSWDVHQEFEASESARLAKHRLDQALTVAGMWSWDWDVRERQRRVVDLGFGSSPLLAARGATLDELIHPLDLPADQRLFELALTGPEPYLNEVRLEVPGRGTRWMQLSGYPQRDQQGELVRVSGVGLDVTWRNVMDEELADTRSLLLDSLQAGHMYCWEWNLLDGSRRTVGPSREILGDSPDRLLQAQAQLHPDDFAADNILWTSAIANKSAYQNEFRIVRPDGQIRWLYSRGNPIPDRDGHITRLSGVTIDVSERHRAEQALNESNQRLSIALEAARLNPWSVDLLTENHLSGPLDEELFGEPIRGADQLRDLVLEEDRSVFDKLRDGEFLRSARALQLEFRIRRHDGVIRWISCHAQSVLDRHGMPVQLVGVSQDISARKQVAEDLLIAQSRLRRALDAAKMVCWDWQVTDTGTRYSPIVAGTDLSREESVVHPDDQELHRLAIADALAGRTSDYRCEFRLLNKDQSITWLLSIGSRLCDASGRVCGLTGVAIDISEQKRVEVQLAESREWQRLAVAAGELNLWRVDIASGQRFGGDMDQRLFGYSPDRLEDMETMIHRADRARVDQCWLDSVESGAPYNLDYRIVQRDGQMRWLRVRGKRLQDAERGTVQMVGATMDISEQKHAEAELRQALQLAQAASAAKSAFLASVSHELRTPLNAVIGFSGLLLDSNCDGVQRSHLNALSSAANQLYSLINDVLDFSRIEAGEMHIESTPFCLQQCLESALDLVAGVADKKGLCLTMLARGQVHDKVLGDPTRLRQIVVNLLANATKFTERGMVSLELDAQPQGRNIAVRIQVRDSGVGMTDEVQLRLFQPFRQGDVSTTRRFGGSGLGLSICKRLIELMQGSIEVHSEANSGSCFAVRLTLPMAAGRDRPPISLAGRNIGLLVRSAPMQQALQAQFSEFGGNTVLLDPDRLEQTLAVHAELDALVVGEPLRDALSGIPNWPRDKSGAVVPVLLLVGIGQAEQSWQGAHGERYFPVSRIVKPRALLRAAAQALGMDPAVPRLPALAHSESSPETLFQTLRVLVAEDNEVNQTLILLQLQSLGVEAQLVPGGQEVLDALSFQEFDLILMDVEMPGMDGMEAATRIRQDPVLRRRAPHIVAVTAHVLGDSRQRFLDSGMHGFISKPVIVERLKDALRDALQARGQRHGGGVESGASAVGRMESQLHFRD